MRALSLFFDAADYFTMERILFLDYQERLKLDHVLVDMRTEFERYKENLRRTLIDRHHVTPPENARRIYGP